ncbi:MAG: glycoside hydrolase family 16 protein [Nocardiopsaceae bacterium]|nr:glycoside hydrolase family 16 protein [Nocardiopsaceae bacterium]
MQGRRMRRHVIVALLTTLTATMAGLAGTTQAARAATPVPYPPALANHPFAKEWDPSELATSPWSTPSNAPGNCAVNSSLPYINSSGYAELDTTGNAGDCESIESPHTYPTADGYVYEADIYFSTWENWSSFWMYGNDWPQDGEIDAVEANLDNNYVTWHYGTGNSTIGTGSWNDQVVTPTSANISPGWHIIDIAFGGNRIQVFYDGQPYVTIPETLTATTDDPMWITFSDGSCDAQTSSNPSGPNECAKNGTLGVGVPGNIQIKWLRAFLPPAS